MSRLRFTKVAQPSTPAANKSEVYVDTTDRVLKQLDDLGVVSALSTAPEINMLINGGFDFRQRAAAALTNITSPSTTNRVYSADRWGFTVGNTTTPQFQQVDTAGAFESGITARYYARYKQLTNAAKIAITQVVEGNTTMPVRGRTVRFQCKMKYSVGSNRDMRLGLISSTGTIDAPTAAWISAFNGNGTDPTLGASLALITPATAYGTGATVSGAAVTCPITTTWTLFSGTFSVPTGANNIMPVIFSNNTFAANDDLLITECGMYDGTNLQDWIPLPYIQEFERCQRFYFKTFFPGTVPASSAGAATGEYRTPSPVGASTATAVAMEIDYPVEMVKAPTLTGYNPAAAGAQMRNQTLNTDCTSTTLTASGTKRMYVGTTTPASTVSGTNILGIHITADAEL